MRFAEPARSPAVSRLAVCAALALATAACSSDANRVDQPFSNPFTPHAETTGSIGAQPQNQSQIQSQPLPPAQPHYQQPAPQQYQQPYRQPAPSYQSQQPLPPPSRASHAPASVQPVAYHPQGAPAGGRGVNPYQPAYAATGPAPRPAAPPQAQKRWDWNGGTPITVAQGETLETVSRRYGVPVLAIAESNGMTTGTPIYPGQRLVIPKYSFSGAPAAPASAPRQPQFPASPLTTGSVRQPVPAQGQVHTVAPGETLFSIARRYHVGPVALAQANRLPPHHKLRMGEQLTIPGSVARAQPPRPDPMAQRQPQQAPAPTQRVAEMPVQQQPTARVITPATEAPSPVEQAKEEAAEPASASHSPGFRWPVRGRVIAGFGPKPTGQQNDGINIAVPEGTPVKASDDGVVAYAGNELKGYGNLVLVRHANGHVTAYAHASELLVKRGESVKRGQTIAKSGQTGNVSSPQLHFEIRKGATPVDPMQHLTGAS
ncbi:MAG: peptidoglycan DD-metalloendopeptidase family protein [Pseudorhodoplanes sp.]|uniref:peptidoglycan DD-metalloendopeptidase family protein n=1 Tax=Pseudorhodoplanes sp. TaxID=1934341 RepID=UPI003D0F73D7